MKLFKRFRPIFFTLGAVIMMAGCNSNEQGKSKVAPKSDSSATEAEPQIPATTPKETAGSGSDTTSEITDTPVYAIWISKKDNNKMYDGLYDSASGYLRLCESKQLLHINDPSEIAIDASKSCYSQGMALRMMIIKKGDSGKPVFLTVLHVDSAGRNLVALTDNNDTIMTSAKTMDNAAFEKLKSAYRVTPFTQNETDKITQYYSPAMKIQNQQKKAQVMKMNVSVMQK
jgi:hypothetical protein